MNDDPATTPGCPRHPNGYDRRCPDVRCRVHWSPDGAPTRAEQLARWLDGDSICPNDNHECCPDFSCCRPELSWSPEQRQAFVLAPQRERERMLVGTLAACLADEKIYIAGRDPSDEC